jgi:predicted GIY-YIG superfamily endonuclease
MSESEDEITHEEWQKMTGCKTYEEYYEKRKLQHARLRQNNVVYILQCSEDTIYIGCTCDFTRRYKQHIGDLPGGAAFTAKYPPIKVIDIIPTTYENQRRLESRIATEWRTRYPAKKICGGSGIMSSLSKIEAKYNLYHNIE